MASAVVVMLGVTVPMSPLHLAFNLPIAVQEMVLAVWLIVKGFNPRVMAAMPAPGTVAGVAVTGAVAMR